MLLALRKDAPVGANWWQRFTCWVIRARLASEYCHAGIVIQGALYHITASKGPHKIKRGDWSPERWEIFDIGGDDAAAIAHFERLCTPPTQSFRRAVWRLMRGYDWIGLLAFLGPRVRVSWLDYCLELCYRMRWGVVPVMRVTPETLLRLALKDHTPEPRLSKPRIWL